MKRKRTAAELDEVLDALAQAIPPEHYGEMRAVLREALVRTSHKATIAHPSSATPDDPAPEPPAKPPSHQSPPAPTSPTTRERASRIADNIILSATRAPEASTNSPLSRRSRERGPGGEGRLPHTVRLSDVAPESLRWLWKDRIPAGKITVLDGDPGLGKSTLLCELAARVSRGDPLPGDNAEPDAPRGVLLFSAEDDVHDTIRPRIDAAGGDPHHIVFFVAVPDGTETGRPFALPRDLPILDAVVTRVDAALVIFDPLVAFLPAGVSASIDQHVRHALGALKASAERTGAAIVVVRHLNKTPSANPLYRGLGSVGIIGAARSGLLLAADPDDPQRRILALAKGNLARPPSSLAFRLENVPGATVARVVWDGESPWTAAELLQGQSEEDDDVRRSVVDDARAWLRETLTAGPRLARELRQEASERGIGRSALYAARKAESITIAKEHTVQGSWVWALSTPGDRELEGEGKRSVADAATPSTSEVQHL
jgi:hypothetical protein